MTRPSADIFAAIASASAPLTLARTADGFLPLLLADLARASDKRLVYVATDDTAMQAVADAAPFFAPDLVVHRFPAWDCLPYDRAGPSMRVSADRLATLSALQAPPKRGELILTTVAAITQRTLTPFRIRQLATTLAPGQRIDRDALAELLVANGFNRVDTVADQGEFAVRGSLVDLFPAGEDAGLRVDFFGDEIESIRRFDPADQRSLGPAKSLQLLPAAETLLDQDTIKRFRSSYREMFGAQATGDPLYQAVSEAGGRRGWTIGCRCSRNGWRRCSTISTPQPRCCAATAPTRRRRRASMPSLTIMRTASPPSASRRAAIARSPPTRFI